MTNTPEHLIDLQAFPACSPLQFRRRRGDTDLGSSLTEQEELRLGQSIAYNVPEAADGLEIPATHPDHHLALIPVVRPN